MKTCQLKQLKITLGKTGALEYSKVTYPIRYGRYHQIDTPDYRFQFNLNGEIKFIQGLRHNWPHPSEWLKRTVAHDWIYYSTGGYSGVFGFLGEYYLPNLSYSSNAVLGGDPFKRGDVRSGITAWQSLPGDLRRSLPEKIPPEPASLLNRVIRNDARALHLKAMRLPVIIEGRMSVLPPDCRHVDYDVIPLIIADGCLYDCGFCRVKSRLAFSPRSRRNVLLQIEKLKSYYGRDLCNYNAVFLGLHDSLYADADLILFAAREAHAGFRFGESLMKTPRLFLFGSATSLLKAEHDLFESLDRLPFATAINIGLESADPETLALIRKPIEARHVVEAFEKMIHINRTYANIEVTANFILSDRLPPRHDARLLELIEEKMAHAYSKGAIYLSPYDVKNRIETLKKFNALKTRSRLPVYLYLIQRL